MTSTKLSTSAITLGYTQITSNFSTSSTAATQATGLTVNVTIPSGGRRIKITAFTPGLYNGTGGNRATMSIWEGTVGSGTLLSEGWGPAASSSSAGGGIAIASYVPSSGSKTYNIGLRADAAGSAVITAGATTPAFILVELI